MSVTGFDELSKGLTELSDNAQKLAEKEQSASLPELITPELIAECSNFSSIEEMFTARGLKIDNPEDFSAIPSADWDSFIQKNTSYESWESMLGVAVQRWTAKKLGF